MDKLSQIPVTMNLTASAVAHGTTTTLSQTSAATYVIRGKLYAQGSAWSNQATPTTDANGNAFVGVLANQGSVFTIGVNHSGTMKVFQGQVQALDSSGNFILAPQFGPLGLTGSGSTDEDFCPLAYLIIQAGSTADNSHGWRFGTDNMSSVTGVTYSFQDVALLPDRPQVS